MNLINRPYYTEKIKPFIDKQIIKVLIGQRRVGKSYVMYQLIEYIKANYENANTIYISKELNEFSAIKTDSDLYAAVKTSLLPDKRNYLFVDEIQDIAQFQQAIRSLFAENSCDIYITGSNANILSGELATFLSGRYIEISIHSLSYREFLAFHNIQNGIESLGKYLTFGGMPYLVNIGLDEQLPFEYLKNVYSTILLKDVVSRANIRNIVFLENLVIYLADNVGSLFSSSNISKYLKSQQITLNPQQIINYLKALSNSFFVHKVVRSEIGGLKIFEIGEKYYFEDLGLRNSITGFDSKKDIHKLMENAIFLKLKQNNYSTYVGKVGTREIDFVADKNGKKIYIQVCLQLTDDKTIEREFGNLEFISDNYPKYVITLNDIIIGNDRKGIKHINLRDFLLLELD